MKNCMLRTVIVIGLVLSLAYADYASDEASLISLLRSNTSVDSRPANRTVIWTTVVLFALNSVDIGNEVMSLSGLLYCTWTDPRLSWDPTSNSIYKIVMNRKHVWVPPLVIENEVKKIGVLGSDGTPLRVGHTGEVIWSPPISSTTSCAADITYYPYDRQTCTITLIGWSYTVNEVDLVTDPEKPIEMFYFSQNGEWDLLSTGYELKNLTNGVDIFRKIFFTLTFRRKWRYYGQNIILPIVLNSVLMAMVFVVPIESGEKMGYCLTVLLSFIVLLTMVSEDLPSISNETSLLQMYLSIVLCVGTLSTVCTIGVLQVHHQDGRKPVPGWLQKLTRYIFAPLACRSCKSSRVVSLDQDGVSTVEKKESAEQEYGWKEIAVILDKCFFVLFAGALLILTTFVIALLLDKYY